MVQQDLKQIQEKIAIVRQLCWQHYLVLRNHRHVCGHFFETVEICPICKGPTKAICSSCKQENIFLKAHSCEYHIISSALKANTEKLRNQFKKLPKDEEDDDKVQTLIKGTSNV